MGFNNHAQRSTPLYYLDVDNPFVPITRIAKFCRTTRTTLSDNVSLPTLSNSRAPSTNWGTLWLPQQAGALVYCTMYTKTDFKLIGKVESDNVSLPTLSNTRALSTNWGTLGLPQQAEEHYFIVQSTLKQTSNSKVKLSPRPIIEEKNQFLLILHEFFFFKNQLLH